VFIETLFLSHFWMENIIYHEKKRCY